MSAAAWWLDVLPLSMLAGVIGLDVVSFPQAMVSRPIVAATLGGAFVGAPVAGLVCGAALECLALEALPVGASRYPEWGSASVVAGAVAATGATAGALPLAGAFAVAVAIGIATAWLGGTTMVRHRQLIARFARPRLEQLAAGVSDQEAVRHSRIDEVIESTELRAFYDLRTEHDFSADPREIPLGSAQSLLAALAAES